MHDIWNLSVPPLIPIDSNATPALDVGRNQHDMVKGAPVIGVAHSMLCDVPLKVLAML
jgi:hypothetical protein